MQHRAEQGIGVVAVRRGEVQQEIREIGVRQVAGFGNRGFEHFHGPLHLVPLEAREVLPHQHRVFVAPEAFVRTDGLRDVVRQRREFPLIEYVEAARIELAANQFGVLVRLVDVVAQRFDPQEDLRMGDAFRAGAVLTQDLLCLIHVVGDRYGLQAGTDLDQARHGCRGAVADECGPAVGKELDLQLEPARRLDVRLVTIGLHGAPLQQT